MTLYLEIQFEMTSSSPLTVSVVALSHPVLLMRSLMTNQFPFLPSKIFFLSLGFWTFLLDMTICKFSPTPKISWYLKDSVKFNPFYFFQSTNISISVIIIIIASSSFLNRI